MKELLTISSNFMGAWTEDKKLLPQVEVILVMSEPSYTVDAVGEVVRQRETSQCRFSASPKVLYKLAEAMTKLAAEAEALVPPNDPSSATAATTASKAGHNQKDSNAK